MGWGKIDDMFDEHPKVLALLDEEDINEACVAITLWTLCFTWAHRNTRRKGKVPGLVPSGLPRKQLGVTGKEAVKLLVKHGLWDEYPEGGWLFHDFAEYLPDAETRAARSAAGKRGAEARWSKRDEADGNVPSENGNQPYQDGNQPSVSHRPDSKPDGKRVATDGSRARARRGTTSSSSEGLPEPSPEPVPPSAGEAAPSPAELTDTQRSKRLTDAYAKAEPMCKWPAVNGVVLRAVQSRKFTDEEIESALLRLAKENRSVTVDALRTELVGFAPRAPSQQRAGRQVSSKGDLAKWEAGR